MASAFGEPSHSAGYRSGDDIRQQFALNLLDLVLQRQLAFLQPPQLELIERAALHHARDHVIEVAVLGFQRGEFRLEGFDVEIHRNSARPGASLLAAARRFRAARHGYSTNRGECIGQRTMRQQEHGKPDVAGEALWRFSLALYARPGVAEALIALQDRAGCDVNLVLFALWLGAAHGHRLDRAEFADAETAIALIDLKIVGPLRQLRRHLKTEPAADLQDLRRRLLALELAAERRVQYRLANTGRGQIPTADRHA